ncbi:type VI secretion system-associated protein TagF [Defluviimonas sp. WL0024]|uniref:Type VI secretion system-associated protein TagF n=1 Tax=Albidovulum salinarum TaxID=2984153 RepID=A0ABT2X7E1_9RHOB|nr:type VI secretion system-associated protein TagF [Defluviimonas sp. WL0024]MCU9849873.1 type VI secretion system-associated protein TagF [Defluviimonas sp. WL0024]
MAAGFGAFGKMPAAGDFIRAGTPPGFVAAWDAWLQGGMLDCQQAFGAAWDAAFMSAPIWRFGISGGLAGPQPATGVLMPSVDRVGRRFPLTLVAALPAGADVVAGHFLNEALFGRLEDLALATLDDLGRPALEEALAVLPAPVVASGARLTQGRGQTVTFRYDPNGGFAGTLLDGRFAHPSIWSTEIDGVAHVMVCDGLPRGPDMQALMSLNAAIWTEARPIP